MSTKQHPIYVCDHCHKDMGQNQGFHIVNVGYDDNFVLNYNSTEAVDFNKELDGKNFCCTKCFLNYIENVINKNLDIA